MPTKILVNLKHLYSMKTLRFITKPTITINEMPYFVGYTQLKNIINVGKDDRALFFNEDIEYLRHFESKKDSKCLKFVVADAQYGNYKLVVIDYNDYGNTVFLSQAMSYFDIQQCLKD